MDSEECHTTTTRSSEEGEEEAPVEEHDVYHLVYQLRKENAALRLELEAFERKILELQGQAKQKPDTDSRNQEQLILLNVGGKYFSTLRSTLCRFEGTFLEALGSGRHDASVTKDASGCYFIDRDPTYFGLVLSFLRDQSLRIEPLVRATNRRLGAPPPPSLASRADGKEHADGMETEDNEGLEETCVLLRELDYYGLINYVLPRQVEVELAQWSSDFADVFSVERYHLKAAQLWVDHFKKETNMAENYYRKAIELDLADEQIGEEDKQALYSRAVKCYHKAASLGHVSALFNLAVCYMEGDGVTADSAKAVRFLITAAEAGHKQSQYQLALCYKQGKGTASDKREAIRWFRKAAAQGHTVAQAFLQDTTWQMNPHNFCAWE